VLRPLDHRLQDNEQMLGEPNRAVQVNSELLAEILFAQHQREYERGLRPDPPVPANRARPVYQTVAAGSTAGKKQEAAGEIAKVFKDGSVSSMI